MDVAAALISHLLGQYLRLGGLQKISDIAVLYGIQTVTYTVVLLLSGYFCELYTSDRYIDRVEMAARIAVSIMIAFFALAACFYAAPNMALGARCSFLVIVGFWCLAIPEP